MVRSLTAGASTSANTELGEEPLIILRVNWSSGTVYYADRTLGVGAISAKGAILEAAPVTSGGKQDTTGEFSSFGITLDDTDGTLKTIYNSVIVEGTTATIYQHFEGDTQADLTVLLSGRIAGDIVWSEGERTLTFDVENFIEDGVVGFAPVIGQITNLHESADGKAWPLGFGTPIHVPSLCIKANPVGQLKAGINQFFTSFTVEGGSEFPQGTPVNIKVGRILFTGQFSGDTFTVISENDAVFTVIGISNRKTNDQHFMDARVLWIDQPEKYIAGHYVFVNHTKFGPMVNLATRQINDKVFFEKPWRPSTTAFELLLDNQQFIAEVAPVPRNSWGVTYSQESILHGLNNTDFYQRQYYDEVVATSFVVAGRYSIRSGSRVELQVAYNNLYVATLGASVEILDVFAYRELGDERVFVPVPSSYYIINASNNLNGNVATTVEFPTSLREREEEKWEDTIYVSYRSLIGPNVVDVISFLLTTYSNLTPNAANFATIRAQVQNFPVNFVVFDQPNVMALVSDIAWQARMVLFVKGTTAYLKYLSIIPSSDFTITENETQLQTLVLGFSPTEDIKTRIKGTYFKDYSGRETSEKLINYSRNTSLFGVRDLEKTFFIYSQSTLARGSVFFWGYRLSNSWRKANLVSFLKTLKLEIFDTLAHAIAIFSTNTLRGMVEDIGHNSEDQRIAIQTQLASKAGDVDGGGQPIEDLSFWDGDPAFPISAITNPGDPGAGHSPVDYDVPTQGQTDPTPGSDTGSTAPGDTGGEQYNLVFTNSPTVVERGVDFTYKIEIQDQLGNPVSISTSAIIALNSTDNADVISPISINISSGSVEITTAQITVGSGVASGFLTVSGASLNNGLSQTFDIIDVQLVSGVWAAIPAQKRDKLNAFIISFSGGPALYMFNLFFTPTDTNDKLYKDSDDSEIITFTTDGAGAFTETVYIKGGVGSNDKGLIIANDSALIYADVLSNQFNVTGSAKQIISQGLTFTQEVKGNENSLDLTLNSSNLQDDKDFDLDIQMKDPNGNNLNTFNGTARIEARDANDNILTWLDAGPLASSYGGFVLVDIINGSWIYTMTRLTVPMGALSPATFVAEIFGQESLTDTETVSMGPSTFQIDMPIETPRAVDFYIQLTAVDIDGAIETSFSDNITLSIDSGDPLDILSVLTIPAGAWSGGVARIGNEQISGGSSNDTTVIKAVADTDGREATEVIYVQPLVQLFPAQENHTYLRIIKEDIHPGDLLSNFPTHFTASQQEAQIDFDAETVYTPAGNFVMKRRFENLNTNETFNLFFIRGAYVDIDLMWLVNTNIIDARLIVDLNFHRILDLDPTTQSPNLPLFRFKVKTFARDNGDPLELISGADIRNMNPLDIDISLVELQQKIIAKTNNPAAYNAIGIDLPIDFTILQGMTKQFLRVYGYIEQIAPIPAAPPYGVPFQQVVEDLSVSIQTGPTIGLRVYRTS